MSAKADLPPGTNDPELGRLNKELEQALAEAALDIVGIADPTPVTDCLAASLAVARGDYIDAGLSLISVVPYVGDALGKTAKGARMVARITKLRAKIGKRMAQLRDAFEAGRARHIIGKSKPFGKAGPKAIVEACPRDIARIAGMLPEAAAAVKKVCLKERVQVVFRNTNGYCRKWLKRGHPPKPEKIKNKTINDTDVLLGASESNRGLVGVMEIPSDAVLDWNKIATRPDLKQTKAYKDSLKKSGGDHDKAMIDLKAKTEERFVQRRKEWQDNQGELQNLKDEDMIEFKDGVILEKSSGKGYTGDYDVYEVLDLDGKPVSPDRHREVINELRKGPVNVQHEAHTRWETENAEQAAMKAKITEDHVDKGDLTIIGPGGGSSAKAPERPEGAYRPHKTRR